jgi:hypothetical protein
MKYIGIDLTKHFRYAIPGGGGKPFVFSPTATGLSAFQKWLREAFSEPVCISVDLSAKAGRVIAAALRKNGHQIRDFSSGKDYAPLPAGFWAFHPAWVCGSSFSGQPGYQHGTKQQNR